MAYIVKNSNAKEQPKSELNKKSSERGYKSLFVWQKATELAYEVYCLTRLFPKEEIFGLVSQLRRSALSVPTNIVEGWARFNKNELKHFLKIAMGSITEVEFLLEFSHKLKYMPDQEYEKIEKLRRQVAPWLGISIKPLKVKATKRPVTK